MLITMIICPAVALVIAMIAFMFYPISRQRAETTRAGLERRRGKAHLPTIEL